MGSYNDKSITSHVFFINKANEALNTAWDTFIKIIPGATDEEGVIVNVKKIETGDVEPTAAKTEIGSVQ